LLANKSHVTSDNVDDYLDALEEFYEKSDLKAYVTGNLF